MTIRVGGGYVTTGCDMRIGSDGDLAAVPTRVEMVRLLQECYLALVYATGNFYIGLNVSAFLLNQILQSEVIHYRRRFVFRLLLHMFAERRIK